MIIIRHRRRRRTRMNVHLLLLLFPFSRTTRRREGKKRAQRAASIFTHSSIPASDYIDIEFEPFCPSTEGFLLKRESERRKTFHSLEAPRRRKRHIEHRTGTRLSLSCSSQTTMMMMALFIVLNPCFASLPAIVHRNPWSSRGARARCLHLLNRTFLVNIRFTLTRCFFVSSLDGFSCVVGPLWNTRRDQCVFDSIGSY